MNKSGKPELEIQRMRYAFWLAVIGLSLSAALVVFLFLNGMTEPNEITAVVRHLYQRDRHVGWYVHWRADGFDGSRV